MRKFKYLKAFSEAFKSTADIIFYASLIFSVGLIYDLELSPVYFDPNSSYVSMEQLFGVSALICVVCLVLHWVTSRVLLYFENKLRSLPGSADSNLDA